MQVCAGPGLARTLYSRIFPLYMSKLIVHGGTPLQGRIIPSSNKNAVLPVLCATVMNG